MFGFLFVRNTWPSSKCCITGHDDTVYTGHKVFFSRELHATMAVLKSHLERDSTVDTRTRSTISLKFSILQQKAKCSFSFETRGAGMSGQANGMTRTRVGSKPLRTRLGRGMLRMVCSGCPVMILLGVSPRSPLLTLFHQVSV